MSTTSRRSYDTGYMRHHPIVMSGPLDKLNRPAILRKMRKVGETWVCFFRTTRESDGKRVENKIAIGSVKDFPEKNHAWADADYWSFDFSA